MINILAICKFHLNHALQTNGLTERFNQTLVRSLGKLANDDHDNWDDQIDMILMGYRASRQASTKFSPYYMLFQTQMRLPMDAEMAQSDDEELEENIEERIQALLQARKEVFTDAESNIKLAQKVQKECYDQKHQPKQIELGTEVLLENTRQKQRKGGKLDPKWLGPYTINRDLGKGLYELRNSDGKVLKTKANVNRLKCYTRRKG